MFDILALVASLLISPAQAQNPTCPTRPSTDNSNACASTAFVQRSASVPSVAIESFGGGCSATVADNTAALLAAVASVPNGVRVTFNKACTYNFTQPNAIRFQKSVYIEGTSLNATFLNFIPTGDGIFLQWLPPIQYGWIFGGGIKNINLYSTDNTHAKVMVDEQAWSNFDVQNVNCGDGPNENPTVVTGGPSYCFKLAGWQFTHFDNVWVEADIPIYISKTPYYVGNDHMHFHDVVLVGTSSVGNFPLVQVDPGASFYDMTWDGHGSWNGGSTGFLYDQSGVAVNYWQAATTPGTGYVVGEVVTVTPGAGGACAVKPKILIVAVGVGGSVTHASVQSPNYGTCASLPAASDWSQLSTTGVGTGLVSTIGLDASNNIRFSNIREEGGQAGTPANNWTIAWHPLSITQNFIVDNVVLQGAMNGLLLSNTRNITIQNSTTFGGAASPVAIVNVATGSDNVLLLNNSWYPLANYSLNMGTLNKVWSLPNWIVGGNDLPASGFWSSQTIGQQTVWLSGDTTLTVQGTYYDGPTINVGTNPFNTWLITSTVTLLDSSGAAQFFCRLWDGTNVYASTGIVSTAAGQYVNINLSATITGPASATIRTSCMDASSANGLIKWSPQGVGKGASITATLH